MAFHILVNSTTADATDVMDNFYHIGQGSRLPMGGTDLANTTAVYNIGASTATWETLYCNNISLTGSITTANKSVYTLIAETTLTDTATSISFTGLNGDLNKNYMIKCVMFAATTSVFSCYFNNDTTTTDYGSQYIYANSTSVISARVTGEDGLRLADVALGNFIIANITSKTGNPRLCLSNALVKYVTATTQVTAIQEVSSVWNNLITTITSLSFGFDTTNQFLTGTSIQLWART